jgi:hypothetical protein
MLPVHARKALLFLLLASHTLALQALTLHAHMLRRAEDLTPSDLARPQPLMDWRGMLRRRSRGNTLT